MAGAWRQSGVGKGGKSEHFEEEKNMSTAQNISQNK
jgi:hypothetical protein